MEEPAAEETPATTAHFEQGPATPPLPDRPQGESEAPTDAAVEAPTDALVEAPTDAPVEAAATVEPVVEGAVDEAAAAPTAGPADATEAEEAFDGDEKTGKDAEEVDLRGGLRVLDDGVA